AGRGEQIARDEQILGARHSPPELVGDDAPAQIERSRLDAERMVKLIDNRIPHVAGLRPAVVITVIEKRDLAQDRVFRRAVAGAVYGPDVVTEIAGDAGQQARVGRDPGAAFEREVEAVEIDAPAHRLWSRSRS